MQPTMGSQPRFPGTFTSSPNVVPIRETVPGYTPINPITGSPFNHLLPTVTGDEPRGNGGGGDTVNTAGVATSPSEIPASGNIPPSTSPYAVIDPTTGDVVNPINPSPSIFSSITQWIQTNPWWSLLIAAGLVWVLVDQFGLGSTSKRGGKR